MWETFLITIKDILVHKKTRDSLRSRRRQDCGAAARPGRCFIRGTRWQVQRGPYTSARKVISRSKFREQMFSPVAERNVRIHKCKIFPLICMRKQMMNIYQPTTPCTTLFHRREPMLAEDRTCLRRCRWSAPAPTCSRLVRH